MGDQKRTRESNSPVPIQRGKEALMPDCWAKDLPQELINSITKLVARSSLEDFSDFGAVCRSWKSAADHLKKKKNCFTNTSEEGLGFFKHQVPLLMVPPAYDKLSHKNSDDDNIVKLYSLIKGKTYKHCLPEIARKVPRFSSLGWLLIIYRHRGMEGLQCQLLHPFNRTTIPVPVLHYHPIATYVIKFVLSSSPSWALDYVVMCATYTTLEFCRPGLGIGWTQILVQFKKPSRTANGISDLVFYKGQFYVVDLQGCVLVCDIGNPKTSVVAPEIPSELLDPIGKITRTFLVESAGVLLVVVCCTSADDEKRFRVFEVPFGDEKSWSESEVKSLGSRTVFLGGRSSSFSIDSSGDSRCKPNCIYFSSSTHNGTHLGVGVFDMEDGIIDQDFNKSFCVDYEDRYKSHLWVQPSF